MSVTLVQAESAVQCAVKCLTGIVLFCPVDTACSAIVGIQGDVVQNSVLAQRENVLSAYGKCMFRNEGYIVAVIILCFTYHIISEGGVCISVVSVQAELVSELCA